MSKHENDSCGVEKEEGQLTMRAAIALTAPRAFRRASRRRRDLRSFTLVACTFLIFAAPLGQAAPTATATTGAVPRAGFYNCYSRTYPITYIVSIQLRQGGGYTHGFADSSKIRFKRVVGSGSYRVSGSRITFVGGPMRKLYGVAATSAKFAVWAAGQKYYSYYCYGKF